VLALAIAASLGPGLTNAMLAIGIVFTPVFTRLVRGQTLSVRERDFVMAARAIGARPGRIMLRHIWPNVTAPIIVQTSLLVASAIVVEAALSFLGLGIEPPAPSWGSMLKGGYQYIQQALWLSVAQARPIFVTVLTFGRRLPPGLDPQLLAARASARRPRGFSERIATATKSRPPRAAGRLSRTSLVERAYFVSQVDVTWGTWKLNASPCTSLR
jgi:peptide/nickel transport system permease protein